MSENVYCEVVIYRVITVTFPLLLSCTLKYTYVNVLLKKKERRALHAPRRYHLSVAYMTVCLYNKTIKKNKTIHVCVKGSLSRMYVLHMLTNELHFF